MTAYDFSKQERARKRKAIWITVAFHLALFGSILVFSTGEIEDWRSLIPEPVKEWLNIEAAPPAEVKASDRA